MEILDLYDNLVIYFQSEEYQRFLLWAKLVSLCITIFFIIAIIILLKRSSAAWWISERLDSFKKVNLPERLEKNWQKIQARLEKKDEANLKLAVIEADNFLDNILKRMGLEGRDMGERLEKLNVSQLGSINEVWDAHRLRNLIVHQPGIALTEDQVQKAVGAFEGALKELEVL